MTDVSEITPFIDEELSYVDALNEAKDLQTTWGKYSVALNNLKTELTKETSQLAKIQDLIYTIARYNENLYHNDNDFDKAHLSKITTLRSTVEDYLFQTHKNAPQFAPKLAEQRKDKAYTQHQTAQQATIAAEEACDGTNNTQAAWENAKQIEALKLADYEAAKAAYETTVAKTPLFANYTLFKKNADLIFAALGSERASSSDDIAKAFSHIQKVEAAFFSYKDLTTANIKNYQKDINCLSKEKDLIATELILAIENCKEAQNKQTKDCLDRAKNLETLSEKHSEIALIYCIPGKPNSVQLTININEINKRQEEFLSATEALCNTQNIDLYNTEDAPTAELIANFNEAHKRLNESLATIGHISEGLTSEYLYKADAFNMLLKALEELESLSNQKAPSTRPWASLGKTVASDPNDRNEVKQARVTDLFHWLLTKTQQKTERHLLEKAPVISLYGYSNSAVSYNHTESREAKVIMSYLMKNIDLLNGYIQLLETLVDKDSDQQKTINEAKNYLQDLKTVETQQALAQEINNYINPDRKTVSIPKLENFMRASQYISKGIRPCLDKYDLEALKKFQQETSLDSTYITYQGDIESDPFKAIETSPFYRFVDTLKTGLDQKVSFLEIMASNCPSESAVKSILESDERKAIDLFAYNKANPYCWSYASPNSVTFNHVPKKALIRLEENTFSLFTELKFFSPSTTFKRLSSDETKNIEVANDSSIKNLPSNNSENEYYDASKRADAIVKLIKEKEKKKADWKEKFSAVIDNLKEKDSNKGNTAVVEALKSVKQEVDQALEKSSGEALISAIKAAYDKGLLAIQNAQKSNEPNIYFKMNHSLDEEEVVLKKPE
ncbi:MAG: hypothetical protein AAF443_02975 [Chlamydiota bacterium]